MDLGLDINSRDLVIVSGDLQMLDGIDAIRQDVSTRLQFFQGEWFLDQRVGIPYYQTFFVKNPNIPRIQSLLRSAITTTPGVISIDRFDLSLDGGTRILDLEFTANTTSGPLTFTQELILG